MRLTEYTDYALRVLMYCAANPDRLVTIAELAERHQVSRNHLMKIVNDLARQGVLATTRGRGGGLRLMQQPAEIRLGDVVRRCETDFALVECFDGRHNTCTLGTACRLKRVLEAAMKAWFKELDAVTLADISHPALAARAAVRLPAPAGPVVVAAPRRRRADQGTATPATPSRPRRSSTVTR
ncbi:MAG: Rrf2 family transcriptional regulator [Burkholderiaceae bacterium]|nr:Rrf2 family transcriptional regulator [Burkholderiaceae bacterium]